MKKKLTNILLILISAFAFTSCGDSKEAVVDDMISLMDESAEAIKSGDKDALAKIKDKSDALQKRAKAVGIDLEDPSTLPDKLKDKYEKATDKAAKEMQDQITEAMKKAMEGARKK